MFAVRKGDADWQEQVITSTSDAARLTAARAWAEANGFDRIRSVVMNFQDKPDFAKSIKRPSGSGGRIEETYERDIPRGSGASKGKRMKKPIGGASGMVDVPQVIIDEAAWRDCTGDCVAGDVIRFQEAVFGGSFKKPKFLGNRNITAVITNDSYGAGKQQHTFTIIVLASDGYDALKPGTRTTRKGRNIYRNGTMRQTWVSEEARESARTEKHHRGAAAREQRELRRDQEGWTG